MGVVFTWVWDDLGRLITATMVGAIHGSPRPAQAAGLSQSTYLTIKMYT